MQLLQWLLTESRLRPRWLLGLTVLSALATVVVIACVSSAAQIAAQGQVSLRLAAVFVIATALYALVQNTLMRGFAGEVESLIQSLRRSLFGDIRAADLATLRRIGQAPLYAALTQETQTISRNLPLLIIGSQQLVLVLFIACYLATLSIMAFALAMLFSGVAVGVHLMRMQALGMATDAVQHDEGRLFDGLGGLLHGLKEVRMSAARAAALQQDLATISNEACIAKSALKAQWGREFALIQLAFYVLVGLMVFVVPMLTTDFHQVALPGTMAALFLIGPIGTVATAIPAIDDAQRALQAIHAARHQLQAALARQTDEAAEPLEANVIQHLGLQDLQYAYPGTAGEPGFVVGPLSARFHTGQITFITGGNGSGKSTLMQLLTGLVPTQGGQLLVDGKILRPTQLQAWRDQIATVFADFHLFSRLYGLSAATLAQAGPLLQLFEMAEKVCISEGAFSTTELSAGQRKRLALIAALLEDKPVLVLDEWAADQDPHFRKVFYETLLPRLRDAGKMVICVTHDDRWFGLADQILHMNEGRLVTPSRGPGL